MTTIMPLVGFFGAFATFLYGASQSEPIFYALALLLMLGAGLAGGPDV